MEVGGVSGSKFRKGEGPRLGESVMNSVHSRHCSEHVHVPYTLGPSLLAVVYTCGRIAFWAALVKCGGSKCTCCVGVDVCLMV